MIKVLYNAIGTLADAITEQSKILPVDSTLRGILLAAIGAGDWTYLALDDGNNVEVVKVYRANSAGIRVLRGQDNTEPVNFAVGTTVRYELTTQEVLDRIVFPTLALSAFGGMRINNADLGYRMPKITDLGGSRTLISGSVIILDGDKEAVGCCPLDNPGTPPIPNPYFYYTSHVYPLEDETETTVSAVLLSGRLQSSVLGGDSLEVLASLLSGALVMALVSYVAPEEDAVEASASLISGILVVRLVEYVAPVEDAFEVSSVLINGLLELVLVEHVQPCDDAVETTAMLLAGNLA